MAKYNYVVRTLSYNGKRYYIRGKTLEECLTKRLELQRQLAEGDRVRTSPTVAEWTETALREFKPNVSAQYRQQMEQRINKHIIAEIGDVPLKDVTVLECQQIINAQAGMSKSHIRKLTQELKFIFRTAKKNGLIKTNPAEDVTPPAGTEGKRRSLTATERYHFLEVTKNEPKYLLFRLMLFCGLRSSEAAEVQFSDVVTIQGVRFFHIRGTKTKAANRLVPIPPELPIGSGEGYIIGEKMNKSKYVRRTAHLKRDMNISMGAKCYRNQLIPPLPLAEDFVPYYLRHTYCTDLKKKGVDLRLAKELMGHSDIKITADIYDHADDESALLAAAQMGIFAT